jgi:hypothetical protein
MPCHQHDGRTCETAGPGNPHCQLGKSVALPARHLPIPRPAGILTVCPRVTVTTRERSSCRARSGHECIREYPASKPIERRTWCLSASYSELSRRSPARCRWMTRTIRIARITCHGTGGLGGRSGGRSRASAGAGRAFHRPRGPGSRRSQVRPSVNGKARRCASRATASGWPDQRRGDHHGRGPRRGAGHARTGAGQPSLRAQHDFGD